jgi:acetyltransferase-like isoleucine patch superfamily enzyme
MYLLAQQALHDSCRTEGERLHTGTIAQGRLRCDPTSAELWERVFFNSNCVVLDVRRVTIGPFTLLGPAVQIYTPMHLSTPGSGGCRYGSRWRAAAASGSEEAR